MESIKIYEIDAAYIDYLVPYAPHLFHNRQKGQANERKYIGVVLQINGFDYFAPLSSFKPKHRKMKEGLDFLKVEDYAVNLLKSQALIKKSYRQKKSIAKQRRQSGSPGRLK